MMKLLREVLAAVNAEYDKRKAYWDLQRDATRSRERIQARAPAAP